MQVENEAITDLPLRYLANRAVVTAVTELVTSELAVTGQVVKSQEEKDRINHDYNAALTALALKSL